MNLSILSPFRRRISYHSLLFMLITLLVVRFPAQQGRAAAPDQPAPASSPVASAASLPELWAPNGAVSASAVTSSTLYLGGGFSLVAPTTGPAGVVDAASGALDAGFPVMNGAVWAAVSDGAGGWYVSGTFTRVGAVSTGRLIHLLPDYSVDPAWRPTLDLPASTLVLSGTTLYMNGGFQTVNGQPRNQLAALNTGTGAVTGWNPQLEEGGELADLVVGGGLVYVVGFFSRIGGQQRRGIAALDGVTGLATAWHPQISGGFGYALAFDQDTVYLGGSFTHVAGQPRMALAAIDRVTGLPTSWNPNAGELDRAKTNTIYDLAVSGSHLYAAGNFQRIGGQARGGAAQLDLQTGLATGWNPAPAYRWLERLFVSADAIYIPYTLTNAYGAVNLVAVDPVTGVVRDWTPNPSEEVSAVAVSGGRVFVGGAFSSFGGVSRRNLVALDRATGVPTDWAPVVDANISAMALSGTTLYIGGRFGLVNGEPRNGLAALDIRTGDVLPWDPKLDYIDEIKSMAVLDPLVYIGGDMIVTPNSFDKGLVAVDAMTGAPNGWDWGENEVQIIVPYGATIYVAGLFGEIGGQERTSLAAIDHRTGAVTDWNPYVEAGPVTAMAVTDGVVYVGGNISYLGRDPYLERYGLGALDRRTGKPTPWNPGPNSGLGLDPTAIVVRGDTVYVGGSSGWWWPRYDGLVALDRASGQRRAWKPGFTMDVATLTLSGSTLYAGGWFYNAGFPPHSTITSFSLPPLPSLATTGPATSVASDTLLLRGVAASDDPAAAMTFEWGTTSGSYTESVTATVTALEQGRVRRLEATLGGLTPGVRYYYRVVLKDVSGHYEGQERVFRTDPAIVLLPLVPLPRS